jgi:hypothetical protein
MKRRYKVLAWIFGFFAVVIGVFAVVVSHNSPCPAPQSATATLDASMDALQYHCYGGPEVLHVEHVPKPTPADDQLLVRGGFRVLLDGEPDIEVVGEASDGLEAIELVRSTSPTVEAGQVRDPIQARR